VAPGAGPLRAIAIRPQVALPARRALLPSASRTDAHLPTVTRPPAVPVVTRQAGAPDGSERPSTGIASAQCFCHRYVDLLHLIEMPDGWKIVNAAWRLR